MSHLRHMARAAGFEANLLGVSDRKERSFNKIILWLGQLDSSAVAVSVGGKDLVLDPGTRFCPFGLLRWSNSGVSALKYSRTNGGFITTPEARKVHYCVGLPTLLWMARAIWLAKFP